MEHPNLIEHPNPESDGDDRNESLRLSLDEAKLQHRIQIQKQT